MRKLFKFVVKRVTVITIKRYKIIPKDKLQVSVIVYGKLKDLYILFP